MIDRQGILSMVWIGKAFGCLSRKVSFTCLTSELLVNRVDNETSLQ